MHLSGHVQVLVVVGNPNLSSVGWCALGIGAALGEIGGAGCSEPNRFVQLAINHRWGVNAEGRCRLVGEIERRLGCGLNANKHAQAPNHLAPGVHGRFSFQR